jgi:hypothetical protein
MKYAKEIKEKRKVVVGIKVKGSAFLLTLYTY